MLTLCALALTQPLAGIALTPVVVHGGVRALDLQARLDVVGSPGTSAKAWVQTSIDGGATWLDLACFAFSTSSAVKAARLPGQALKSPAAIAEGTLADDSAVDGPFGERFRVKVTSVGSYGAGTTLSLVAIPRS
jgi:hypothetical protein